MTSPATPGLLRASVAGLNDEQLSTPYRPGGWTVRQVIHHVPDSHMNAYVRFKLALTENEPTIKPYDEAAWAELVDGRETSLEVSHALLDHLHDRWVRLLRSMSDSDFSKQFRHPDLASCRSIRIWLCMRGTANITQRILRVCVGAWDGGEALERGSLASLSARFPQAL